MIRIQRVAPTGPRRPRGTMFVECPSAWPPGSRPGACGLTWTIDRERRNAMSLPTRVNRATTVDPFESMQREFDTLMGRFFNGGNGGAPRLAPYGVDVREDQDHIYVEAELPGFRKDEVDITLENQTL